jgi:hypothetical protein
VQLTDLSGQTFYTLLESGCSFLQDEKKGPVQNLTVPHEF